MADSIPLLPNPTRAGRYIRQATGYRAFIPAPLPPIPPLNLGGEIQSLLSQADRALGRLDGSIQTLPNPNLFVFMYVRKEAVLSSQIEGTQSSLNDLLAAEAKILTPDQPKDVDEVVNYPIVNEGVRRVSGENNLPRLTAHVIPVFGLNNDSLVLDFRKSGGGSWVSPFGSQYCEFVHDKF